MSEQTPFLCVCDEQDLGFSSSLDTSKEGWFVFVHR